MNGSDFKTIYETTVNKTVKYWHKPILMDRQTGHWNRIGSPELNPHVCSQLTYNKGISTVWEEMVFSINDAEAIGYLYQKKKLILTTYLHHEQK